MKILESFHNVQDLDNLAPTSFQFDLWSFPKLARLSVFYSLLSVTELLFTGPGWYVYRNRK